MAYDQDKFMEDTMRMHEGWRDEPLIIRCLNGNYEQDCELMTIVWNSDGHYIGQWQEIMLDDEPGRIFIKAGSGSPHIPSLTEDQMRTAP